MKKIDSIDITFCKNCRVICRKFQLDGGCIWTFNFNKLKELWFLSNVKKRIPKKKYRLSELCDYSVVYFKGVPNARIREGDV